MKIDKESLIVILLASGTLLLWFLFYPKYQAEQTRERERLAQESVANPSTPSVPLSADLVAPSVPGGQQAGQPGAVPSQNTLSDRVDSSASGGGAVSPSVPVAPATSVPVSQLVTIENALVRVTVDSLSGAVTGSELLQCLNAKHSGNVILGRSSPWNTFSVNDLMNASVVSAVVEKTSPSAASVTRTYSNGVVFSELFSLPDDDSYQLHCKLLLTNPTAVPITIPELQIRVAGLPPTAEVAYDKIYSERHNVDYAFANSDKVISADPAAKKDASFLENETRAPIAWLGSSNKYFAALLFPEVPFDGGIRLSRTRAVSPETGADFFTPAASGVYLNVPLLPNQTREYQFRFYAGPKESAHIRRLPESAMSVLHVSYFSWFEPLARPLVRFLVYLKSLCGNYGLAIILLTLIVRILFWPITQKANTSMRKMQKLKPKMDEIREKYKGKPELQQEMNLRIMELYREEKVSPLGGCLPILLQLPVFLALYSALDSAVELRQVSFLWCSDLTKPDLIGPSFTLPLLGSVGLHPLVIAMSLLMFAQQKMTPSAASADQQMQQKIMLSMPFIMLVMLYNLPSGLTLYWTVSQVFSIIQLKYGLIVARREEEKAAATKQSKA